LPAECYIKTFSRSPWLSRPGIELKTRSHGVNEFLEKDVKKKSSASTGAEILSRHPYFIELIENGKLAVSADGRNA
jgi:hypothetical protein